MLFSFSFSSYQRSAATRDQIAPNRCPGCKQTHPPTYLPTSGTTWMQSLRDYGSWRKLSSSGARNMRLAPIRCNHPPTEEPTSAPTSRPSRTSCAIPGSMAGCSLRCQPDLRESDQDSFSICLRQHRVGDCREKSWKEVHS